MTTPTGTPLTFVTTTTVTDQQLADLFTTAMEGGVSYWAGVSAYHWHLPCPEDTELDHPDLLGFSATLRPEDGEPVVVDRSVLILGLQRLAAGTVTYGSQPWPRERQHKLLARLADDTGDYDSSDAEMLVQAGLFGDITYG